MLNFWVLKFVVCYQLIKYLGLSGSFWSPLADCLCLITAFFLDSGGFSVWLISLTCGDGRFVFWSVDATDIRFDNEWTFFDWSVVIEGLGCSFLFEIDKTLIWWVVLWTVWCLYQMFLLTGYYTWDIWKMVLLD